MKTKILKYGKKICGETRKADFLRAFEREVETTRIFSFGACNFHCPYCKRDCQLVDTNGNPIRAEEVPFEEVLAVVDDAVAKEQRVRLSGGDPVMFPKESLAIAKYAIDKYGQKISIAHNGSGMRYVKSLAPYLDYAAIDLKGHDGEELAMRAGIPEKTGDKMLKSTLAVQDYLASQGVLVDVRTPVFDTTTLDNLHSMAEQIVKGGVENKFWTLRKYNPVRWIDWGTIPQETLLQYAEILSKEFPELPIGLRLKWSGGAKEFIILKGGKRI